MGLETAIALVLAGGAIGVSSDWDLKIYGETGPLDRAVCSFEMDLFNEGLPTGPRGPSVVFYGEDRRWVHASVYALLEGEAVREASGFRRVHLVGEFPDGTTFERKIVQRQYFVAARTRTGGARKDYVASYNLRSRLLGTRRAAG